MIATMPLSNKGEGFCVEYIGDSITFSAQVAGYLKYHMCRNIYRLAWLFIGDKHLTVHNDPAKSPPPR